MDTDERLTLTDAPAHAGIDPTVPNLLIYILRCPRTRGDRPKEEMAAAEKVQMPPHTRG